MIDEARLHAKREEIQRLENKIRKDQARLAEKRKALAADELLAIKAQLDGIDIPFDELMDLLRKISGKGGDDREQDSR